MIAATASPPIAISCSASTSCPVISLRSSGKRPSRYAKPFAETPCTATDALARQRSQWRGRCQSSRPSGELLRSRTAGGAAVKLIFGVGDRVLLRRIFPRPNFDAVGLRVQRGIPSVSSGGDKSGHIERREDFEAVDVRVSAPCTPNSGLTVPLFEIWQTRTVVRKLPHGKSSYGVPPVRAPSRCRTCRDRWPAPRPRSRYCPTRPRSG